MSNLIANKISVTRTLCTILLLTVAINLNAADLYQTTANLNLRSGPSPKYNSIGIIKRGENVTVIEKTNSLWFKIEHNGKSGFLSSKFLIAIENPKIFESPKIDSDTEDSISLMFYIIGALVVIMIIIFALSGNKKLTTAKSTYTNNTKKSEEELTNNIKIEVTTSSSYSSYKDDSVIDVTDNHYKLNNSLAIQSFNEDWKLGNRYKNKLKLNEQEVITLNNLIDTDNKFNSTEEIAIELIRMFFDTLDELQTIFKLNGTSFQEQANAFAEIAIANDFRYKNFGYNKPIINTFTNDIYQCIYKSCENKLRDYFSVGRKTDFNWYLLSPPAFIDYNNRFQVHINKIIQKYIDDLKPTEEIEILLNKYDKNRWKIKMQQFEQSFTEKDKLKYIQSIYELEKMNKSNPNIENIFFQASRFIAKYDKVTSLRFYIYYLYYDLKSTTFNNKQITKTIQKSLFEKNEQLHDFEVIVIELIKDKDLNKALSAVPQVYAIKRKPIVLDKTLILEEQKQHSETIILLDKILNDEHENESTSIKTQEINSEEVEIKITQKSEITQKSIYSSGIEFTPIQLEALEVLSKNNFSIPQSELEAFAKSKGVFSNQLIERINEICFEILDDDVLIEEEDEYLTINPNYYQRLLAK